jgi:hypothetical protein
VFTPTPPKPVFVCFPPRQLSFQKPVGWFRIERPAENPFKCFDNEIFVPLGILNRDGHPVRYVTHPKDTFINHRFGV